MPLIPHYQRKGWDGRSSHLHMPCELKEHETCGEDCDSGQICSLPRRISIDTGFLDISPRCFGVSALFGVFHGHGNSLTRIVLGLTHTLRSKFALVANYRFFVTSIPFICSVRHDESKC